MFQRSFLVDCTHLAGGGRELSKSVSTADQTLKVNAINRGCSLVLYVCHKIDVFFYFFHVIFFPADP